MDVHFHELRRKLAAPWATLLIMTRRTDVGTRVVVAIQPDADDPVVKRRLSIGWMISGASSCR
jgi:hypothetical protein